MARNSEKAQSMLFRFLAHTASEAGIVDAGRTRRPKMILEVASVPVCEKWRSQVLKEISRKVMKIQDEGLSDAQLRDLNDEINKLMREKWMWERRIGELGGGDHRRGGGGRQRGYQYFGRARELPGVKELFEETEKEGKRGGGVGGEGGEGARVKRRWDTIDARYFGYLDEDDDQDEDEDEDDDEAHRDVDKDAGRGLLGYEKGREREMRGEMVEDEVLPDGWEELPGDTGDGVGWRIPSAEEVQEELVERRRRRLLDRLG